MRAQRPDEVARRRSHACILVKRHELGHGLLDEFGRVVHGDVGRALDDVQALVAAPGAPEGILAEPERSGPAAGDEPERLRQKLSAR